MDTQYIFALDIGTRTVIGLICKKVGEDIHVVAHQIEGHQGRAMRDGQIHDIPAVALAVKKVKTKLEKKLGVSFKQASIAAAGRALRTERGLSLKKISKEKSLSKEDIEQLKLEAVSKSKEKVQKKYPGEQLYCVGYSVIETQIDGYQISKLEGQKGAEVTLEIISTYLPQVVIDSLFEVLKRAEISIKSLTLEPIAAMDIAIKENLRMLNIALVDVGAGTSDIAISKGGTVVGFGMVQKAGDKITEALGDYYLLDFQQSEKIKLEFGKKDKVTFKNVLGIQSEVSKEEFCQVIKPAVEELAQSVAEEIIKLNRAAPKAIFCIGGGSQIPMFKEFLAEKLGLPKERVAIRDRQSLEGVKFPSRQLTGPEVITPLGIASVTDKTIDPNFFTVKVNDKEVSIFNSQKTKVAQALFNAGVDIKELLGSTEKITYTLNGEVIQATAKRKMPSMIKLNGQIGSLDTPIKSKDTIEIVTDYQHTGVKLGEIIAPYKGVVLVDSKKINLIKSVKINGVTVSDLTTHINNGDNIEINRIDNITGLAQHLNVDLDKYDLLYKSTPLKREEQISANMELISKQKESLNISEHHIEKINIKESQHQPKGTEVLANGKKLTVVKDEPKVVDVFDLLQVDITVPKGTLVLTKNKETTDFSDSIKQGDEIEIYWSGDNER
ncbi:cell division FtsA domain-containing protein [Proteinivorax tanatarense]|uniref:Cell division FtsA domain-containing protein n=1 Tax=Proteinivorax tanatarense TaxID=1260629 RepID=A0AAU7VL36_9FIRM